MDIPLDVQAKLDRLAARIRSSERAVVEGARAAQQYWRDFISEKGLTDGERALMAREIPLWARVERLLAVTDEADLLMALVRYVSPEFADSIESQADDPEAD